MRNPDGLLRAWQRRVRARPLLYRLTPGTRLLPAVGFVLALACGLAARSRHAARD